MLQQELENKKPKDRSRASESTLYHASSKYL